MAFVFDVIKPSILFISILKVCRLMSQKTTFALICSTTFAVEIHVNAGTITSSSGFNPRLASER